MEKQRILCLHGYGTNKDFMDKQIQIFKKYLKDEAEILCADGPFEAPQSFIMDQRLIEMIEGYHRSWLPNQSLKESSKFLSKLEYVRRQIQKYADSYDGIIGFSQGTVLGILLCRLQQEGTINWKILKNVKYCLFFSGNHWKFDCIRNDLLPLSLPSIHFISQQDFIFSKSIITTTQFINPHIIMHSYGHRIPKLSYKEVKFVQKFVKKYRKDQKSRVFAEQSKL